MNWLLRTSALIGEQAMERLKTSTVAVIGLGGVGGSCAEAVCRSGVGSMVLMDHDTFDLTNLNRQLFATTDTIGRDKISVALERLHTINPDCQVTGYREFYSPDTRQLLFQHQPDFIIDAIDTVTAKLDLMEYCFQHKIPLISSMGTGNRLDPSQFKIGDIADTAGCGCKLARVIRRELKKRAVTSLTVLYSTEMPAPIGCVDSAHGRHSPASISFTPPVAGYLLAAHAVKHLAGII